MDSREIRCDSKGIRSDSKGIRSDSKGIRSDSRGIRGDSRYVSQKNLSSGGQKRHQKESNKTSISYVKYQLDFGPELESRQRCIYESRQRHMNHL